MPHNSSSSTGVVNESDATQEQAQGSNQNTQVMAMMATANPQLAYPQEYSLPAELESGTWFADSGASHHLKFYDSFLHNSKSYVGSTKVYMLAVVILLP